ncbi:MAG: MCE family protein [Actinomycetota bacterium]|nr:MCE family protein [Actinomycetota bacterium]
MMRRIAGLLLIALMASTMSACGGNDTKITAEFSDAAGLFVGNDVGVLGVKVGTVTKIDPAGPIVRVTMSVDPGVKVPSNAGAVIVSRSVATDRYVELTPVYDRGATMKSGTLIALKSTRNPVEFDELLSSIDSLTGTLAGPDDKASALTDVLSVGADVLDGNGKRISQTVADLSEALEAVNGNTGDGAAILDNLDTLTKALAANDKTVRDFSDNVTDATKMLDDEHLLLQETFDALAATLKKVASFVRDHRAEIGDQLDDIATLSRTLLDHQKQLGETLEVMPLMMQNVDRAVDSDDRLTMKVRPGDLIPGETAAKALCSEIPGGACDSLDFSKVPLFKILDLLAGVSP